LFCLHGCWYLHILLGCPAFLLPPCGEGGDEGCIG
jgi:hypothetical protein